MQFSVRAAQTGDVERLLEVFAAAFQDDEIVAYVAPYRAQYPVAHRETMRRTVHGLLHDACSIAMVAEVAAGAAPADLGKVVDFCQLQLTSGRRIPVCRRRTRARRHLKPFEVPLQHLNRAWTLKLLATDPQYQGRGAGSLLVGVAGSVADLSGVPLVVSTAENARGFYARLGFELAEPVGEVCMLIGGDGDGDGDGDDKVTVRLDGEDEEATFWTAKQRRRLAEL
ncbi:hypothetical protein B0T26DRAFT_867001 [Lasiosphaeria miniovina]|uniref:N-acetyltransferase domain-containing protein n=1 Tax=Lasiosphaeria miniovina TaxID=1954250 RepID=A0AA40EDT6_9PEZI|nr:uncharacterized protein B0T26DRAFT_867001 [Lasiosphaeria miniovina]KAK0733791.1 hypothetical protein B0T26DRAFT_867001 [Lasiosphaeria miniovina]